MKTELTNDDCQKQNTSQNYQVESQSLWVIKNIPTTTIEYICICFQKHNNINMRIKTVKGLILTCGGNYRKLQVRTLNEKTTQDKYIQQ